MAILYFLILLSVIICIHELGHLAAAKLFGVYCYEFSFGMGPCLFSKKTKETTYSIRAIPVGGYVSMAGETDGDELYPDAIVEDSRRLINKPIWQRVIVMLAGVTMNFLLCYVILSMLFLYSGAYASPATSTIATVSEDSPAQKAGFLAGDTITKVELANGAVYDTDTFTDVQIAVYSNEDGAPITFTVERSGEELTLVVTPQYDETSGTYLIGIGSGTYDYVPVNFLNCWKYGFLEMKELLSLMVSTIQNLIKGIGLNQLSGPVGVYSATEESVSTGGLFSYFFLIAELSLNVGIVNLIPLPALDGGQVILTLAEGVLRKPLNTKVKGALMGATWVVLIGMMLLVTWNDLSRIFG